MMLTRLCLEGFLLNLLRGGSGATPRRVPPAAPMTWSTKGQCIGGKKGQCLGSEKGQCIGSTKGNVLVPTKKQWIDCLTQDNVLVLTKDDVEDVKQGDVLMLQTETSYLSPTHTHNV